MKDRNLIAQALQDASRRLSAELTLGRLVWQTDKGAAYHVDKGGDCWLNLTDAAGNPILSYVLADMAGSCDALR